MNSIGENPNRALSQKALEKAVNKTAIESWIFQYPLFTIAGLLGVGLLFGFNFWLVLVSILLAGVSPISYIMDKFIRNEKIKLKYIQQIKQKTQEEIRKKNQQLKSDLQEVNMRDAAIQLEQFQRNFQNFEFVLNQKFRPEELAFNRYYSIVQEIVLGGMNNLQSIYLKKKNLIDSNPDEVVSTLKSLERVKTPSNAQKSRIHQLQRRLQLYEDQKTEIDELLSQNEKAITAIEELSRKIASLNTSGSVSADMEQAMDDLIEMTEFVKVLDKNYSNAIKV